MFRLWRTEAFFLFFVPMCLYTETHRALSMSVGSCFLSIMKKAVIGKLFKKKNREKRGCDARSDIWLSDSAMNVSRSRSRCSFRGGYYDQEGGTDSDMAYSSAKNIDFNQSKSRNLGFRVGFMDFEIGFSAQKVNSVEIMTIFGFIDLKVNLLDESKT
ncbi:hypothetical protein L2E82_45343 [Cichorium intybus]|uniref:Uncharacterized protein n=1 Tax=Cichorium intybus TaxID=13427 RepID=A0ACB8ZTQ1_CICIN|nr:hypothetical protein L2E82_45343 [Cichorium intybus]